jgi:PD-(D/E)XK nuclease superfamily
MWPENNAFSPKLHTLQLFWDSTSLGALKKCPRYYELTMVQGWTSRERKVDLEFGIHLHAARERYYHARARGELHEAGVDAALQHALTATWDSKLQRPWQGDSYKNRYTLAQAIVDYCDKWEHDPLVTVIQQNKLPAVEVSFRFPLGFGPTGSLPYDAQSDSGGESEEFWLCGHLDRVVEFQSRLWISDLKSTRHTIDPHYFAQFSPDNQFNVYSLAGQFVLQSKIAGIIVDAVQVLATQPPRFGRALIERTEAQLAEFVRGLHVLLRQAEYYARHNFWPQNEKACFRCEFRAVCSKSPSVRERWLQADFVKRVWNPTEVRGDI